MSVILNFEEEKIFRQWVQTHTAMSNGIDTITTARMRAAYEAGIEAERKRVEENQRLQRTR